MIAFPNFHDRRNAVPELLPESVRCGTFSDSDTIHRKRPFSGQLRGARGFRGVAAQPLASVVRKGGSRCARFRPMVGRSTPRYSNTRQGYAPAPRRAPDSFARTPLRGDKQARWSAISIHHEPQRPDPHSGWCDRCRVARVGAFLSLSPVFMFKRIFRFLRITSTAKAPSLSGMSCIRSLSRDGIRVEVYHHQLRTGHFEYWFQIDLRTTQKDQWIRISTIPDGQLQTIIDLLQQALDSLDRGWRQLRSVPIRHKTYFVDDRLMQLRNIEDPNDFIDLGSNNG